MGHLRKVVSQRKVALFGFLLDFQDTNKVVFDFAHSSTRLDFDISTVKHNFDTVVYKERKSLAAFAAIFKVLYY